MTGPLPPCVVLAGGVSVEREVSLRKGAAVAESLQRVGATVRTIDPPGSLDGFAFEAGEVAVIALHGAYGEDGTVQRELSSAGVPFTGAGVAASRLAFDKWAAREAAGVEVADGSLSPRGWSQFPCVVKPRRGGSSFGLSLVRTADDLPAAWEAAGEDPLVEAFVDGEEWTVAVLGGRAMTPVRVRPAGEIFDTRSKYDDARSRFEPLADTNDARYESLRTAAATAAANLGAGGLCRSDFIWSDGRPVFLELNTVPGMTDRSLAPLSAAVSGLSFDTLVAETVRLAVESV